MGKITFDSPSSSELCEHSPPNLRIHLRAIPQNQRAPRGTTSTTSTTKLHHQVTASHAPHMSTENMSPAWSHETPNYSSIVGACMFGRIDSPSLHWASRMSTERQRRIFARLYLFCPLVLLQSQTTAGAAPLRNDRAVVEAHAKERNPNARVIGCICVGLDIIETENCHEV